MYDNIKIGINLSVVRNSLCSFAAGKEEEIMKLFAELCCRIVEVNCLLCEGLYVVVRKKIINTLSEMSR